MMQQMILNHQNQKYIELHLAIENRQEMKNGSSKYNILTNLINSWLNVANLAEHNENSEIQERSSRISQHFY
jgi:hypothetical protein